MPGHPEFVPLSCDDRMISSDKILNGYPILFSEPRSRGFHGAQAGDHHCHEEVQRSKEAQGSCAHSTAGHQKVFSVQ